MDQPLNDATFGFSDGYRVFLAGETHSESKSVQAEKMLVKYFYEEKGVRTFLFEIGLGASVFLDQYVQTGNEEELEYYMQQLDGTLGCTKEVHDFYQWLSGYNQGLPEGQKLHVVGLDVDHQASTAAKGLSLLMNDAVSSSEPVAEAVRSMRENPCGNSLDEFVQAMRKNPSEMQTLFGDACTWADQICRTFEWTKQYYNEQEPPANDLRDEVMMSNFLFVLGEHPQEAFFGEFGSEHILQSACETDYGTVEDNRFGMRLNADTSPVKGRVCSILYTYPKNDLLSKVGSFFGKGIDCALFESRYNADAFFSLDEVGSPFSSENHIVKGEAGEEAAATDFVQKIMVLPNSGKTTAYR